MSTYPVIHSRFRGGYQPLPCDVETEPDVKFAPSAPPKILIHEIPMEAIKVTSISYADAKVVVHQENICHQAQSGRVYPKALQAVVAPRKPEQALYVAPQAQPIAQRMPGNTSIRRTAVPQAQPTARRHRTAQVPSGNNVGTNTPTNLWVDKSLDCFKDPLVCVYGTCCCPLMFMDVGTDAYDVGGEVKETCLSDALISCALGLKFPLCTACCCPRYFGPCFFGHILGRFRKKYNLPSLRLGRECHPTRPSPCYFPDCCQMFWCGPCTVCLMYRQMKFQSRNQFAQSNEPYIPSMHLGFEPYRVTRGVRAVNRRRATGMA